MRGTNENRDILSFLLQDFIRFSQDNKLLDFGNVMGDGGMRLSVMAATAGVGVTTQTLGAARRTRVSCQGSNLPPPPPPPPPPTYDSHSALLCCCSTQPEEGRAVMDCNEETHRVTCCTDRREQERQGGGGFQQV